MTVTRSIVPQNFIISNGTVLEECNNVSGWTLTSGNMANNAGSFYSDKNQTIRLTVTAAGSNAQIQKTGLNLDLTNFESVEFVFKISLRANMQDLRLAFHNDSSNYFYCYLPIQASDSVDRQGWYKIRVTKKEFVANGTPSWSSAFTRIGIRSSSVAGQTHWVDCDRITYNIKAIPKILFTFDDGWQSNYDKAFPIMQAKGFKGTVWVVSNFTQGTDPNYMRKSTLDIMYAAGWDIGNHSKDHDVVISTRTVEEQIAQFKTCRDMLYSFGYTRSADHVCFPAGDFSDQLIDVIKSLGAKSANTTLSDIQVTPLESNYKFKRIALGSTTTIQYVMDQVDKAISMGASLMFMLHRVEDTPIDPIPSICFPTALFQQTIDYIASKNIDVLTISEWYDQMTNPRKQVSR